MSLLLVRELQICTDHAFLEALVVHLSATVAFEPKDRGNQHDSSSHHQARRSQVTRID